jgi:hypothetical protein
VLPSPSKTGSVNYQTPEQLAVADADWKKVKDYYLSEINKVFKQK